MPAAQTRRRPTPAKPVKARPQPVVIDESGAEVDEPGLIEVTVTFDRDGVDEVHTFQARPRLGYKQMRDSGEARRKGGEHLLRMLERMIRPALLDNDGTPAKWEPEIEDGQFADPVTGELRPVKDLPEVTAWEAGSSRARWLYLMDDDDDLQVDVDQIVGVYEQLVEAASDRPTQRRS